MICSQKYIFLSTKPTIENIKLIKFDARTRQLQDLFIAMYKY